MKRKISHIGIPVKSIENSMLFYKDVFGLELIEIEEVPEQKVKVAMFQIGDSKIELLEPTSDESPIAKFLEKKKGGIHHLAIEVDNVQEELDNLAKKGIRLIDKEPRIGAGGVKIAFVHPKSTSGVLLELCEKH